MKLYDIGQEYIDALESLVVNEETGEVDTSVLDEIGSSFDEKVENIACFIKQLEILSNGIRCESKSLEDRAKRIDKKITNLKDYLSFCLSSIGKTKVETPRCQISFRKSSSIEVTDATKIPPKYMKTTEKITPDKTLLKEAIESGVFISGVSLVEKQNIQIR